MEQLPDIDGYFDCGTGVCNGKMVRRKNRKDGSVFYGCSNYPRCTFTRSDYDVRDEYTHKVIGEFDYDTPHLSKW
jgi:ssDNA-binding Zn-finger/Zn-ribbon topoisomerase 1